MLNNINYVGRCPSCEKPINIKNIEDWPEPYLDIELQRINLTSECEYCNCELTVETIIINIS